MRITNLEVLGLATARGDFLFVKLHADNGLFGLGSASLTGPRVMLPAYLRSIAPHQVIGADPFATEALVDRLVHGDEARVNGLTAAAASLLEVACWDLVGKALDLPIYRLLGGPVRDRIKAYASAWMPQQPTAETLAAAARQTADMGYRALAFDPFAGLERHEPTRAAIDAAARRAEVVRAAVGPEIEILIELGSRFTPASAIRIARALERVDPTWIADPLANDHARTLALVGKRVRPPLAASRNLHHRRDLLELIAHPSCVVLQPDLAECCGFLEARKIAATAEVHAMSLALRQSGGPVAAAATLHLAATLSNVLMVEARADLVADALFAADPNAPRTANLVKQAASGCPEVIQGDYFLPQGPGLGLTLDEDLIRAHPLRDPF